VQFLLAAGMYMLYRSLRTDYADPAPALPGGASTLDRPQFT
jgi:hypothetical protein